MAEEVERPPARQLTLDEALPPAPADEEHPPLIIRRMGRVLSPEGEEAPEPRARAATQPAELPQEEGELIIRRLAEDPTFGQPPPAKAKRSSAPAAKRTAPSTADEKPPARTKTEVAPTTGKKRSTPKRTDVGISPVLSGPVTSRQKRETGEETDAPRNRKPPGKSR